MTPSQVRSVLFIIPGENIDTPSPQGNLAHKFDFIYDEFLKNNWKTKVVTDVYTKSLVPNCKYKLTSANLLFICFVFWILLTDGVRLIRAPNPLSYVNQSALHKTYKALVSGNLPRVVLTIGAQEALVKVCGELGIQCIEIQHGMFEESDLEMYWPNRVCPNGFLTWDDYSGRIAQEHGMDSWVLGHPDEILRQKVISTSEKKGKFVCVSLGYNSVNPEDPWGCFPKDLTKVIDDLIEANVPIFIRLHPNISARKVKAQALRLWISKRFGDIRVDSPRDTPLSESVRDSFCNLTVVSATWFEFALAGRPTAVLDKDAALRYQQLGSEIEIWQSGNCPVSHVTSYADFLEFAETAISSLEKPQTLARTTVFEFIQALKIS
jgi:hypothetical protein